MINLIAICFRNIDFFQRQTNLYVLLEITKGKNTSFSLCNDSNFFAGIPILIKD